MMLQREERIETQRLRQISERQMLGQDGGIRTPRLG